MKITNLTPHALHVVDVRGNAVVIPPSGTVARLPVRTCSMDPIETDLGTFAVVDQETHADEVEGLPTVNGEEIFVVSRLVMNALKKWRGDIYSPGELIRDSGGNVVGCKGFSR